MHFKITLVSMSLSQQRYNVIKKAELRTGMKLRRADGAELITMIDVPDTKYNTFKSYFLLNPESKTFEPTKYTRNLNYDMHHPQLHIDKIFVMEDYKSNPFSTETKWVDYDKPIKLDEHNLNNYMKKYNTINYYHHQNLMLSDLHTGLKVELRNGEKYICMTDVIDIISCTYKDFLLSMHGNGKSFLFEEYNDDLSHKENSDYDIVNVKIVTSNFSAFKPNALCKNYVPIVPTQEDINNYIINYC